MKIILFLISLFLVTGCDIGSGSSTTPTAPVASEPAEPELPPGIEKMEKGKVYVVTHGDYLVKTSEETQVKVIHKGGETVSTIELVLGEANIVRKQ